MHSTFHFSQMARQLRHIACHAYHVPVRATHRSAVQVQLYRQLTDPLHFSTSTELFFIFLKKIGFNYFTALWLYNSVIRLSRMLCKCSYPIVHSLCCWKVGGCLGEICKEGFLKTSLWFLWVTRGLLRSAVVCTEDANSPTSTHSNKSFTSPLKSTL